MAVIYLQKLLRGRVVQNMVCRVQPLALCFCFENRFRECVCAWFLRVNSLSHPAVLWNYTLELPFPLLLWIVHGQGHCVKDSKNPPAVCHSCNQDSVKLRSAFFGTAKYSNFLT